MSTTDAPAAAGLFRLRLADGAVRLARGAVDAGPAELLPAATSIDALLAAGGDALGAALAGPGDGAVPAGATLLAPVENQEVWAAGVTYRRSRDARMEESVDADCYARVYEAERPEVFMKAAGWRVRGPEQTIGVRDDSGWDVPEPELGLVLAASGELAGYVVGNDVSSRTIEGANPLYLPQAKIYDKSCAVGPALVPVGAIEPPFTIRVRILRDGVVAYADETTTANLKRGFDELAGCLMRCLAFPVGALLLTGTCLVPPETFSLAPGDVTEVEIPGLGLLRNPVERVGRG